MHVHYLTQRMDLPPKQDKTSTQTSKRLPRPKRTEELVTTPADSEEEAEQIHQILEDLNNIVNSEMNGTHERKYETKKEKEIVPVHLVKSPPKRSPGNNNLGGANSMPSHMPRPWPGSSASDDDDSDILDFSGEDHSKHERSQSQPRMQSPSPLLGKSNANVRRVVEQLEKTAHHGPSPKLFQKNTRYQQQQPNSGTKGVSVHLSSPNMTSGTTALLAGEPKPDYTLPNFHKQNHMASKFANFKSSKLYSSSPDNSSRNYSNSYAEVYEKSSSNNSSSRYNFMSRFSPNLEQVNGSSSAHKKNGNGSTGLRRSESLHASLASIETERPPGPGHHNRKPQKAELFTNPHHIQRNGNSNVFSWKSMENLDNNGQDDNFTLRWKYPPPQYPSTALPHHAQPQHKSLTPSPKNSKGKTQKIASAKLAAKNVPMDVASGDFHLIADYRQNRFTKNTKANSSSPVGNSSLHHQNNTLNAGANLFRYAKKSDKPILHLHPQQQHQIPAANANDYQKEKENMKMFSLPPMIMTSSENGNHRISDLPSGLY